MANVNKAGDLLSSLFREQFDPETLENARITAGLFSSWAITAKEANIPAASDHCRIRDLERGVLLMEAEHPGWVQLLQTKQNLLLKSFQKKFPELKIQGISFCLSKTPIYRPIPETGTGNTPGPVAEPVNEPLTAINEGTQNESIKKFKKIIQKRNRGSPDAGSMT